jgi:hypothetical protein
MQHVILSRLLVVPLIEMREDTGLVEIMMRWKSWRDAYQQLMIVIQFPRIVDSTLHKQLENEVTTTAYGLDKSL